MSIVEPCPRAVISQRFINYTFVHSSKRLAYFFHIRFFLMPLKVVMRTSSVINEAYNDGFAPEFSVSELKEIIELVRSCTNETRK